MTKENRVCRQENDMRAVTSTLIQLCTTVVYTGIGPIVVGALTDLFTPSFGVDAIRYSFLTTVPGLLIGGVIILFAGKHVVADLARIQEEEPARV